jgi:hypothetical protein
VQEKPLSALLQLSDLDPASDNPNLGERYQLSACCFDAPQSL